LSASDLLIDHGHDDLPAIRLSQVSQNTIEIAGARGSSLKIRLRVVEESAVELEDVRSRFCASATMDVADDLREQVFNFYSRLLAAVVRSGHGCLAAVLQRNRRRIPQQLKDGVLLEPAIDVTERVSALLRRADCEADSRLRAAAGLIRGMLFSDGITVFGPNGTVRAYNVFVRVPQAPGEQTAALGGARRRAFDFLCSRIGRDLCSAFFLSQDGHSEYRGH
jgi:hypothetical protein